MIRALWTSATGMMAQQVNLDVVANNMANVNTAGFKRDRADFQDLMYQALRLQGVTTEDGSQIPTGINIGHGTVLAAVQKLFTQGNYEQTENQLDLAIEGNGFLQVTLPSGDTAYTRAGTLKSDSQGRVVTSDGYPITPNITIPQSTTNISIETDGTVSATVQGQSTPQQLGTIELATFSNPAGLRAMGKNLFLETDASGTPITGKPGDNGLGTVLQGYLESSNVSVVQEMVNMIVGQRAYEANSKSIQAADEMLRQANNLRA
ncbi:MAG TPA: flagellar basal-body rod protein FlgG [Deltaproteobacteria bacterium]|nr:flagellar basal-body rod protein FlgG [Deltaproteobacteria bacterium]